MHPLFEKNLISTKAASDLSGYNSDYLSRLCRSGKITGTQVGRTWLVSQRSLEEFVKSQSERKQVLRSQLSEEREKEYRHAQIPVSRTSRRIAPAFQEVSAALLSAKGDVRMTLLKGRGVAVLATLVTLLIGVSVSQVAPFQNLVNESLNTSLAISDGVRTITNTAIGIANERATNKILASAANANLFSVNSNAFSTSRISLATLGPVPIKKIDGKKVVSIHTFNSSKSIAQTSSSSEPVTNFLKTTKYVFMHPYAGAVALARIEAHAYVNLGATTYVGIQNGLTSYADGIQSTGNTALSLASSIRDFGIQLPYSLAENEANLALAWINFSKGILHDYSNGVYAWVNQTPTVPAVLTKSAYDTGSVIADSIVPVPSMIAAGYQKGINAWVTATPAIATSIVKNEVALGTSLNGLTSTTLALENANVTAKVESTSQEAHGTAIIAYNLVQNENKVLKPAPKTAAVIQSSPRDMMLGVLGNASVDINSAMQTAASYTAGEQVALATYNFINSWFTTAGNLIAVIFNINTNHLAIEPNAYLISTSTAPRPNYSSHASTATLSSGNTSSSNTNATTIINKYSTQQGGVTRNYVDDSILSLKDFLTSQLDSFSGSFKGGSSGGNSSSGGGGSSSIVNGNFVGGSVSATTLAVSGDASVAGTTTLNNLIVTATSSLNGDVNVGGAFTLAGVPIQTYIAQHSGTTTFPFINAVSTTATSTFAGDVNFDNGEFIYSTSTHTTSIANANITNATIANSVTTNATTTNATTTNGYISNLTSDTAVITNATTTNFFATLAQATTGIFGTLTSNLATIAGLNVTDSTTTNATSTNLYSTNGSFGNLLATIANFTSAFIGNLTATNATTTNATSTNLFATNISGTNANLTNADLTNATIANSVTTNATTTNATTTNGYTTNFVATNATVDNSTTTNAYISSLSSDNALVSNATTTNATSTNLFATNITGTNAAIVNATTTNASSTNLYASRGVIDSLVSLLGNFTDLFTTNLFATNSTTTNATSTNFFATNGSFGNLLATIANFTSAFIGNLTATNAVLTNATSTNFVATNITGTNANLTNATVTNATIANSVTTNATSTNATSTNLFATNISGSNANLTNASSTNFFASFAHIASGLFDNFNATLATIAGLNVTNSTTTSATSTNAYATNFTAGNASVSNLTSGTLTSTSANIVNATTTNATSTNFFATNISGTNANVSGLTLGNDNGVLTATNGVVAPGLVNLTSEVTNVLPTANGGTGFSSYANGIVLISDGSGNLTQLPAGGTNQVLKIGPGGIPYWGLDQTVGSGGNDGIFATSSGAIYPLDTSSSVLVGTNAATNAANSFEVHGISYFSGNVGIASSSPTYKLSVEGISSLGNRAIAGYFTATTTTASTFPYASTTAISISGANGLSLGSLNGPLQANNGAVSATTSIGVHYGGTGLTTAPTLGQLLVGNSTGGYALTSTSSLRIAVSDLIGTTDNLAEGVTNLYFTDARADARINATTTIGTLLSAPNLSTVSTSLNGFLKATAGALSTSLINLTSDVAGILPVTNGGTGTSSFATNGVLYGNGTNNLLVTSQGTANSVLVANNGAPSFSSAITIGTSVTSPILNATTAIELGGVNINTTGTLSDVAYLDQADNFTAPSTFTYATSTSEYTSTLGLGSSYFTSLLGNGLTNVNGVLTVSTTSLGSGFFAQGGNAFGVAGILGTTDNNPLTFITNNTEKARFTAAGSFGIGTTTPGATLGVNGSGLFNGSLTSNSLLTSGNANVNSLTVGTLTGFLKANSGVVSTSLINAGSDIVGTLAVGNGGTGSTTLTGLLKGNGIGAVQSAVGDTDYQKPITLTTTGTGGVATFTGDTLNIPNYAGGVTSVSNADGTLSISPTTGAVVAGLNLAHANTFTALQQFANSSSTLATANTLFLPSQTSTLLKTTATGQVVPAVSGTDYQPAGAYITGNQNITLSGDVSGSGTTAITTTLATVNGTTGSFGSSTAIPTFTVNGKGLITAAGSVAVVAPAGTLTGTTLASNVLNSSLTSVGTLSALTVSGLTTLVNASSTNFSANTLAVGGTGTTTINAAGVLTSPSLVATGNANVGSLTVGTLTGFLKANSGVVSTSLINAGSDLVGTLAVANGGTGTTTGGVTNGVEYYNGTTLTNDTGFTYGGNGGNVGIGTITPAYKLDVAGFINTDQYSGFKQNGNTVLYASTTNSSLAVGDSAAAAWMSTSTVVTYDIAVGQGALASTGSFFSATKNTALGYNSLFLNTTGANNTATGYLSLASSTTGVGNSAFGSQALVLTTVGNFNTASGYQSLYSNTSGANNAALGAFALSSNTVGANNTAVGEYALSYNTDATSSVAIGALAGAGAFTPYHNQGGTYVGYGTGYNVANNSDYNTFLGYLTGYDVTTGNDNIIIGTEVNNGGNHITTGSNNIGLGYNTVFPGGTGANNQLNIGNAIFGIGLTATSSGTSIPAILTGNIGIATSSPNYTLDVGGFINTSAYAGYKQNGFTVLYASTTNQSLAVGASNAAAWLAATSTVFQDVAIGQGALGVSPTNASAVRNTAIGFTALNGDTTGANNVALGHSSLYYNTTGGNNTATGYFALGDNTTGVSNIANGALALSGNTTGSNNSTLGYNVLSQNITGSNNTAIGSNALYTNLQATNVVAIGASAARGPFGNYSNQGGTYIGYQSGYNAGNNSDYNTFLGYQAGYSNTTGFDNILIGPTLNTGGNNITTGANNIGLGYNAVFPSATANNQLNIGNTIFGTLVATSSSTSVPANLSATLIGIGTSTPLSTLAVGGNASIGADYNVAAPTNGLIVEGNIGIGTTSPYALLSIGNTNGIGFTTGTSTFNTTGGINLANGGCYAVNGTCLGTGLASAVTSIGPAGQLQNGPAITLATTSSATTGLTIGTTITGSGNTLTYAPTLSGTLAVANGGTGISTAPTYGQLLVGNASGGYTLTATSSLGISSGGGSGTVGSGTTGQLPYYAAGGTTLTATSSLFLSTNGNVGVGTTIPAYTLDVGGFINTDQYSGFKQAGNTVLYASTTNISSSVVASAAAAWMAATSTPFYDVAVGQGALATSPTNATGIYNTALGYTALNHNTTGSRNVGIGSNALGANTTGAQNAAVGAFALQSNTTGNNNTAFGYTALNTNGNGSNNTGIGNFALASNTSGSQNNALGTSALYKNTNGSNNTANGYQSLFSNITGSNNSAFGYQSLLNNTLASSSVSIGYNAALGIGGNYTNQGGTYLGFQSGYSAATSSDFNTFLGYQSGYDVTTGNDNILIGANVNTGGSHLTTGANNIGLGYNTIFPGGATANNQLNIGNFIFGTGLTATSSGTTLPTTLTGSIGIGTSTPLSTLAVGGNASIGADYNVAAPTNGLIVEGNVGIGSTSPTLGSLVVRSPAASALTTIIIIIS
jgi:hypothetical protein